MGEIAGQPDMPQFKFSRYYFLLIQLLSISWAHSSCKMWCMETKEWQMSQYNRTLKYITN